MSLQNLFVAKLPRNVTDADLHQIFAQFEPTSAKVMLDATTGKSKGFGFVLFDSEEKGSRAYHALNRTSTRSCRHNFTLVIYPSNHDGRAATEASNALYIRNIPKSVSQKQVEQFLRSLGNLAFCAMREDHHGSPVWVVYAEYETVEHAKLALNVLHGNNTFFQGGAPILAKFEDSETAKRERRRRREAHQGGSSAAAISCVFPPPRAAGEARAEASITADTDQSSNATGSFPGQSSGGSFPPLHFPCTSLPPHHAPPPNLPTGYSFPFHALPHSAPPGLCYSMPDPNQPFLVSTAMISQSSSYLATASNAAQSTPQPREAQDMATVNASLLRPQVSNPMVFMDGQQFVLSNDTMNMTVLGVTSSVSPPPSSCLPSSSYQFSSSSLPLTFGPG